MFKNKKGAALMQVLLMTMILAGMATMLLRASLSRTVSARKTRRSVSATVLIEACMAEVNAIWSAKNADAYMRDLEDGYIYCEEFEDDNVTCKTGKGTTANPYICDVTNPYDGEHPYKVKAFFNSGKQLVYKIDSAGGSANL